MARTKNRRILKKSMQIARGEKFPVFSIKVKNTIPIISSTTPAPKIAVPTLVFSFFISIKDSTVILTEVAVMTMPKNKFKELSKL